MSSPLRRAVRLTFALALLALVVPGSAFGQSTRTWVSGVGDDVNPCSRTAPCKTFAGTISKTAAGGVMNTVDPGSFGSLTITKSITIRARLEAGVLASSTNGIVINAGVNDKVVLDGLDITGVGTGAQTALTGVKVLQARSVQIRRTDISRMQAGVAVVPTANPTRVTISDSFLHDNGVGLFAGPAASGPTATAVIRRSSITENTCGIAAASTGPNASTPNANTNCGSAAPGAVEAAATVGVFDSGVHDNGVGIFSRGPAGLVDLSDDAITGSSAFGLQRLESGQIRSFGSNVITGNTASDGPSSTVGKS